MSIDLNFRPRSYFWPLSAETHLLSTIKGAERRSMAQAIHASGHPEALSEFVAKYRPCSDVALLRDSWRIGHLPVLLI